MARTIPAGKTPPVAMRLREDTLSLLDRISRHFGTSNRTETVRRLIHDKANILFPPKKPGQ